MSDFDDLFAAMGLPVREPEEDEVFFAAVKDRTIIQQQAKLDTYITLRSQGLPIPPDLKSEVENSVHYEKLNTAVREAEAS